MRKEENMHRHLRLTVLMMTAALIYGCADPAADKPKASVANAAPESSVAKTAATETLAITPENSKVEFVGAKVTRSHEGSFKKFVGTIDLVPNALESSKVTIDIDPATVVTDEDALTTHLKSPDFFDVAKYPKATFVSTKIEKSKTPGSTHTITGNFELHGIKNSVSFPATIQVAADNVSVNSEFAINRKDFGIVYPGKVDDLIRDGVVIKLTLKVPRLK
jgi:polyisoprenoid-binding protein YceI